MINVLDVTQPCKLGTINWVEVNDDPRGMNSTNSQIKFKNAILKSGQWDYSDTYILANSSNSSR